MFKSQEITIARKAYFSAALKDCEGRDYGHDFQLEVYVRGPLDPVSGLVMNLTDLDLIIKKLLLQLDHKHLFYEKTIFPMQSPSSEDVIQYAYLQLSQSFPMKVEAGFIQLVKVKLHVNENESLEITS